MIVQKAKPMTNIILSGSGQHNIVVASAKAVAVQGHSASPEITVVIIGLGIFLAIYLGFCFLLKRICEKCGVEPGILIWIPIFNMIRLLQAGGLSGWYLLLLFIPLVNLIICVIMWWRICDARGKNPGLSILMLVPFVNVIILLYLALAD